MLEIDKKILKTELRLLLERHGSKKTLKILGISRKRLRDLLKYHSLLSLVKSN